MSSPTLRPAIFLDRDGVINYNRADHVKSWAEFEFLPGSLRALRRLAGLDWPVVVVSNQSAVGRGLVGRGVVEDIHARMLEVVVRTGGRIDAVLFCPHPPDAGCACRKPNPGMLLQVAGDLQLDLPRSFLVGDAETDVLAALAVGCRPVLVKTGRGAAQLEHARARLAGARPRRVAGARDGASPGPSPSPSPLHVAEGLAEAVEWIMRQARGPAVRGPAVRGPAVRGPAVRGPAVRSPAGQAPPVAEPTA